MKYIKTFEDYGYRWKNIIEKDGNLYINLHQLIFEMENHANKVRENKKLTRGGYSIPDDNKIVSDMETEYITLVRNLIENKVISFNDPDFGSHYGLCTNVSFESGPFTEDSKNDSIFQFEYISIKIDNEEDYYNVDEEVIVYLDLDSEMYKTKSKFNI